MLRNPPCLDQYREAWPPTIAKGTCAQQQLIPCSVLCDLRTTRNERSATLGRLRHRCTLLPRKSLWVYVHMGDVRDSTATIGGLWKWYFYFFEFVDGLWSVLLSLSLAFWNILGDTFAVLCADLKSKARVWLRWIRQDQKSDTDQTELQSNPMETAQY